LESHYSYGSPISKMDFRLDVLQINWLGGLILGIGLLILVLRQFKYIFKDVLLGTHMKFIEKYLFGNQWSGNHYFQVCFLRQRFSQVQ